MAASLPVALGIAGVTAVFAVVDGVLLKPLPYEDPGALVKVGRPLGSGVLGTVSTANLIDLEGSVPGLLSVGGVQGGSVVVEGPDPVVVRITRPTRQFMATLGVKPVLGRTFVAKDWTSPGVALITWPYWQRRFGGAALALGSTIDADLGEFRVVGILPRSWRPPEALLGSDGEIWIPIDYAAPTLEATRAFGFSTGVGRLASGSSLEAVNEQLRAAAEALFRAHPSANAERDGSARMLEARPLLQETVGDIGRRLNLLFGAVAMLLAIACANVANLFLTRGAERQRELAMRTVLGAGRGRLVVQFLVESLVVASIGGAAGLLLAWVSLDTLVVLTPDLPRVDAVTVDLRVVAAAFAATLVSGVAFGLVPALTAAQRDPGGVLRGGSQPRPGADRLRGILVAGQMALTLVLVVGGGLLVNTVVRLSRIDPGFSADGILTMRPRLNPHVYGSRESAATPFYTAFTEALAGVPGVRGVTGTMFGPGQGLPVVLRITAPETGDVLERWRHTVLPGFFRVLEIPILEGRPLGEEDGPGSFRAAVVSQSLARELWPGESAVGRTVRTNDGSDDVTFTVVGVAADIRNRGPHQPAEPVLYESYLQNPWLPSIDVLVRHDGDAATVLPAIRRALRAVDPAVPLGAVAPLPELLARNTVEPRHYAILLGVFSLVALAIAAVGVYATVSYTVARRFREMGIRRAVGARGGHVARLVIGRALAQTSAGALLGLALAAVAVRTLEGLLFEITPSDPATWIAVTAVLLATALLASALPALRAMRADPLTILHGD